MPSNKKMDRRTNLEKWAEINLDEMDDLEEWIDSEIPGLPKDEDISENEASQLRDILAELYRRDNEGLNLYEPMPDQELFHASQAPERVALGGNRGGKAQPVDEPVLTPKGWRPIGSLRVGDSVISGSGRRCLVTGVFPQGVKPVFRVTFDDGATTRCCEEHLWKARIKKSDRFGANRLSEKWSVVSLGDIRSHGGDNPVATKRASIPVATIQDGAFERPFSPFILDPYLVGAMIGDGGYTHQVYFCTSDTEMVELVRDRLPEECKIVHSDRYDYRIIGNGTPRENLVKDALVLYGMLGKRSWEKSIPGNYLMADRDSRIEILRGLMDTDGHVSGETKTRQGQAVEFCTTSPQLARDVEFLVRSLGGKCRTCWRVTNYTYPS
jgi:hypothetical protein